MVVIKKSVYNAIMAKSSNSKLDYFKHKILSILSEQEKRQNNRIVKSILYEDVIKGRAATVGEIREWKGKKFKKMPNGKWVRVYDKHDKHAQTSIARLKGRVQRATSIDELYRKLRQDSCRPFRAAGELPLLF